MANEVVEQDAWDSAEDPKLTAPEHFGEIVLDIWSCSLVKGVGKVPYDPAQHEKRFTAIKLSIIPLAEQNVRFDVVRDMIAESKEWAGGVLPSIKSVWSAAWGDFSLRALNGKFAHTTFVGTGQTYVSKTGETKEKTNFKFLALFANESECRTAFLTGNGTSAPAQTAAQPPAQTAPAPAVNGNGTNAKERETALIFLKSFVKKCDGDLARVTVAIAGQPLIAKYYDGNSIETMNLCADYAFEQAIAK